MTRLIASEGLKLRTTRAFYALAGGALGFTLVIIVIGAIAEPEEMAFSEVSEIAFFTQLIALIIGILCITNEFRHGTITPTLLVSPTRTQVVLAKVVAGLVVGLVLGFVAVLTIAVVVVIVDGDTTEAGNLILGGTLAAGLYAVLGVGVGALIRNQVGAIIGALVYIFVLEGLIGLIPRVDEVLPKYGLGGTSQALRGGNIEDTGTDLLAQLPGGLLLAAYVVIFLVAGIVVMQRRDVTA